MRRDVGRHTNRDTNRSVDQKVWEARRQNGWLLGAAVVVVLEINGVFVDIANHLHRQGRHAALGVTRGSGRVISWGTEVTLARNQWVAKVPVLDEAYQSVIDRAVTVWVVLTHNISHDTGALGKLLVWAVSAVIHCVKHATVNWL